MSTLSGLCLLLHRDLVQRLGLFDERFGNGNFEDDDFCLRARLLGYRLVIARDAFLHHEGHSTFRALGLDYGTEIARRRVQFEAKWRSDPAGAACLAEWGGTLAAAVAHAEIGRRTHPEWPDADWLLARHRAVSGDRAGAVSAVTAFLRQCPDHSEAHVLLGLQWLHLGELERGQALLQYALSRCHLEERTVANLLRELGELAREHGRHADAIANFEAALSHAPNDAALHNWLGISLLETGRYHEAIPSLEVAAAGGFALAHTNLGICWFHRGDRLRALEHFGKAVELLPHDPTARRNLEQAQGALPAGTQASTV